MKTLLLLFTLLILTSTAQAAVCSTVGQIPTAIHYGDTITAEVQGCSVLPETPGPKWFTFWPRYDPYSINDVETGELAVGCPAGAWSSPVKTITWTTYYDGAHPVIDIQWYYASAGGSVQFEPNLLNNGCRAWFQSSRPTTSPCDPMTICTPYSIMFCQDLHGAPAAASTCLGPFGMVVPPIVGGACACSTVLFKQPLDPQTKAMWKAISAFSLSTAAFFATLNLGGWPPATEGVTRGLALILYRLGPPAAALANDPPDPNWLTPTPLIQQPYVVFTAASGFEPAQITAFNTLFAKLEQATSKIEAASVAMDRWSGAMGGNGPVYQDEHIDEYNQYVAGAQVALGKVADVTATMNDATIWKKGGRDWRPILKPLYDATAQLRAWATADLSTE